MKLRIAAFPVVAALALGGLAACSQPAQAPAQPPSPTAAEVAAPAPATPASVEPLAFLAGQWCGKDANQQLEETWMLAAAGEAIGMSRTVSGGRMISFEFMRIAEIEGKVALLAQPNGDPPVSFARTDGGAGWIRFENKAHDYPQRIEYRSAGADGLHAEIGGPGAPGKEEVIAYDYERCK